MMFAAARLMASEARGENERALFSQEAINTRYRELDEREVRLDERDLLFDTVPRPIAALPSGVRVLSVDKLTRTPDRLGGYVRPVSLAGTTVLIQRQQGTAWPTVGESTVEANGDFLAKLQLTTGVYRARVSSGNGFVVGFSPVLQVSTS